MGYTLGLRFCILFIGLAILSACSSGGFYKTGPDKAPKSVVSTGIAITLRDQKLTLIQNGKKVREYPISSSKYGLSAKHNSYQTPYGLHRVSSKVGDGQPIGMVFKRGRPTGEIVAKNSPGRDPIVTRIIRLGGVEANNKNSGKRGIFIHGTPEEKKIGYPASYGCIRMRSHDIVDLYRYVRRGTPVAIELCSQPTYLKALNSVKRSSTRTDSRTKRSS